MKKTKSISIVIFALFLLHSCSTKKDTFISRNFHALTTKYNVLFNGKEAFKKGLEEIANKHQDNYWKRLQIEPITFDDSFIEVPEFKGGGPGLGFDGGGNEQENKTQTPFDKAEEKAVKAIQKHSINPYGYERNRQIDDAYLLLGKARYYTQRFIPAVEALNYVIENYPKANLINETKVWRAKANLRLGNEKLAIETMQLLIDREKNEDDLPDAIKEQAHTTLAMAYEQTDTIEKVKYHLKKATETIKNKEQSARNLFVLGQIYSEENKKDSARMVFKRIVDTRKFPYKYRIHATIELAKNTVKDSSSLALIERFKKMTKNIDNRKYLDELYYQIGVLEEKRDSVHEAISYYKKSLKTKNGSPYQKTFTYEKLGNIAFNELDYITAGMYYDSVAQIVPKEFKNERRIRRIKRKNKGLTALRKYDEVVANNDSILRLVAMSKEDRATYFEKYIEKLKKEEEERKQQALNAQNFGSSFGVKSLTNTAKGKWYFYNTQSLGFGKATFEKVWGNRKLEDNWRWADKNTNNTNANNVTKKDSVSKNEDKFKLITYLSKIPKKKQVIDSLVYQRNDALYQLGLIYKEQFKNAPLSIQNFERLLKVNNDENLILPINYHLYQLYVNANNKEKENLHKNIIVQQYPESVFAQIISSPNKKISTKNKVDEVEKKYKKIYYKYKNKKYEEVVKSVDSLSPSIQNSKLIPKFELLKAMAMGKYQSTKNYKKALEFVAFSYANTQEGKKAKEIINQIK